jgi:hypothetical protein
VHCFIRGQGRTFTRRHFTARHTAEDIRITD